MYHAVPALIGAYKIRKVFAVHHIMSPQHSAGLIGKKSGIIHISKSRYYFDKDNLGLAGTHHIIKFLPFISHIVKSFKCLPYLSGYTIGNFMSGINSFRGSALSFFKKYINLEDIIRRSRSTGAVGGEALL